MMAVWYGMQGAQKWIAKRSSSAFERPLVNTTRPPTHCRHHLQNTTGQLPKQPDNCQNNRTTAVHRLMQHNWLAATHLLCCVGHCQYLHMHRLRRSHAVGTAHNLRW